MSVENEEHQTPKNLINIITFNVAVPESIDGGIIPWINIGRANEQILNLIDAEELVIPEHQVTVAIDYPFTNPLSFQLYSSIGFSRKLLLIEIREKFLEMSDKPDESFDSYAIDLVALDVYKTDTGNIELTLDLDI